MTAYTSAQSGKFNTNSTWVGGTGHPSADGDTFTIAAGHLVEYDADNSALTNGFGASTVNGTLFASRTAGAYVLKISATLTIATTGTLDASDGSNGVYASTNTFTITTGANITLITVSGSGLVTLRCTGPTHKYAKLSQAEASGQAVCHVDTNLTVAGDGLWANPSLVRVDNVNQGAQSEQYTISSVSSTAVTLTGNLSNSKLIGSYVILVSRNVKLVGAGTGTGISGSTNTSAVINAEVRAFTNGIASTSNATIGGTITNTTTGLNTNCANCTVNASMSGASSNLINGGFNLALAGLFSGSSGAGIVSAFSPMLTSTGIITGCASAISSCVNTLVYGTVANNNNGFLSSSGRLSGATFSNNTADIINPQGVTAYNSLLGSTTEVSQYNLITRVPQWVYNESFDHDQVSGAYKAWTLGGIVTAVASPVYDSSRVRSYQHTPESASLYVFMQRQLLVPAGASLYVRCYVQKDVSMSYLPRLWIFSADKEPLNSGSPDAEVIMTNSTNTWEVLETTVTNTTSNDKQYVVRTLAKNASGNFYADPIVRVSSFQIAAADMAGGMLA